jgi:hypothetical protein
VRGLLVLLNRSITVLLNDGDIMHTQRIARVTGMLEGASEKMMHVL